jgi:hypothetical protein
MADKTPIINKIQKLLSLANSQNENEAKAAMNMANTLLIKHNISIQQVTAGAEDQKTQYQTKNVKEGFLTLRLHQKLISELLQNYFFVKIIIISKPTGFLIKTKYDKTIQLIGTKENCEIASYIFSYLDKSYPQLWKTYLKNNSDVNYQKTSYYHGLTRGIKEMLETTKWKVEEEMGLTLTEDLDLVAFVKQKTTGNYSNKSVKFAIDQKVYNDGIDDGANITLRKPINSEAKNQSGLVGIG